MIGFSTSVLGWKPAEFWLSTPHEYNVACSGWLRYVKGVNPKRPPAMTRAEAEDLWNRFPD